MSEGWRHLRVPTGRGRAIHLRPRSLIVRLVLAMPLIAVFALVMRGCHVADLPSLHAPKDAAAVADTSTTVADLTQVALAPVNGTTTSVPPVQTGSSTIDGNVTSAQGAVPGATVRIERIVSGGQVTDIQSDASGHYQLGGIAGGRYRVRAFLPPNLAQANAEVFFLAEGDRHDVDLNVEPFTGIVVSSAIAPEAPQLNQAFTLAVRVGTRVVDADGVVHNSPLAGASVTISPPSSLPLQGASSATTNGDGTASFTLVCNSTTDAQVTATARGPGPPSTTSSSSTTTSTSTTQPASSSSATATTLPAVQSITITVPACVAPTTTTASSVPTSSSSASSSS